MPARRTLRLGDGQAGAQRDHSSGGTIGGRGNVNAGYICGIIATALLCLSLLFVALFVVLGLVGAFAGSSSSY
ncbi:hypothetical protein [Nocardia asiatica]|uniref:hypothetical protein n=1 Tax=Nocardia asiatica TaxID=209252 RepID=UPI003EE09E07